MYGSLLSNTFVNFIGAKGDSLKEEDLQEFARTQFWLWLGLGFTSALVSSIFLVLCFEYLPHPVPPHSSLLPIALLLLPVIAIFTGLSAFFRKEDLELARYTLKRLQNRARSLERALSLSTRIQGIALFLRTFRLEQEGKSASEVERWNRVMEYTAAQLAIEPMASARLMRLRESNNIWTVEEKAIRLIHTFVPCVMLENVGLSPQKRYELEEIDCLLVPILPADWWPSFVRLAESARVIIIFLDAPSSGLLREIEFLSNRRTRCIVICSEEVSATLSKSEDQCLSRILLEETAQVITYRDFDGGKELQEALTGAIRTQVQSQVERELIN